MPSPLQTYGYQIQRSIFQESQLKELRIEADHVAKIDQSTCVRNLTAKSQVFYDLAHSAVLKDLIPPDLVPVRSILFDKTESENWSVAWHQDLTISVKSKVDVDGYSPWSFKDGHPHVQPPQELLDNMVTLRIHLDDTPSTNGALRVIATSHLLGKISSKSIAEHTSMKQNPNAKNPTEIICDCLAGDVLLMKPLLLHSSRKSSPPERRRVVHFEYACGSDLHPHLQWAEKIR